MKFLIKSLIIVCISFTACLKLFSQSKVLHQGEELKYIVAYGFIKLGEVNINLISRKNFDGGTVYLAQSKMRSYKGVPFMSLNTTFESEFLYNGKEMYSIRFKAIEYKDDATIIIEYKFNYDSNYVYVKKINNGKIELDEKIKIQSNVKFQDGLSLFYKARLDSFSPENFLIPVFMNEAETSVSYYFSTKPEEISIDLFEDDINSVRCYGVANFEGIFGLTGEFAGWFSMDEERIPLSSQLNLLIGNTTLELESYKRPGWTPKK